MALSIIPMEARHGVEIRRQPSQRTQLGLNAELTLADAQVLCDGLEAWAALDGDRVVAICGLLEEFTGCQAMAWGTLCDDVGAAHHVALTRFLRSRILAQPVPRLGAIVACCDMEPVCATFKDLDAGQLVAIAMELPTPGMRWALAVGFKPATVLRKFGAESRTHMLFERIG